MRVSAWKLCGVRYGKSVVALAVLLGCIAVPLAGMAQEPDGEIAMNDVRFSVARLTPKFTS